MSLIEPAALILEKVLLKSASLKSLVYQDKVKDKKKLLALICGTLKFLPIINDIIKASNLLVTEKRLDKHIAILMVYQLLFFKGSLNWSKLKPTVKKHQTRLRAELAKLKIKHKVSRNEDLLPEETRNQLVLPRYVRVSGKSSVDKVIAKFIEQGYKLEDSSLNLSNIAPKTIRKDLHVPNLLIFPPSTDLHENPLFLNGTLILQDKASCFPAYILNPPKNATVIDACAAPGNKTSHLSSIMKNTGQIFAFDASSRRLETLNKLCSRAGCTNIISKCLDFLTVDPHSRDFINVEYILLDPSCSGSGIVSRMNNLIDEESGSSEEAEERLKSLAEFQQQVILHAFKFPNVKRVVYSTCSINEQENEMVVEHVLKQNKEFRLVENIMSDWKSRGVQGYQGSKDMIRADPKTDYTIGFFVVLFERVN